MTDSKTATERLRELLDERGVEWKEYGCENHTWWEGANSVGWHAENRPSGNGLYVKIEAVLTPEQAIAATLGSEQPPVDKLIRCLENDYGITASWDGLRRVWFTERATLGSGECEMDKSPFMPSWRCSACGKVNGGIFGDEQHEPPIVCPNCGKAVKR